MSGTHYDALGVPATASQAEIKTAYRKLVLQHHPDRSTRPESAQIFREATEAYEVLSDPERRKVYDETLERIARHRLEQERLKQQQQQQPKRAVGYATSGPVKATADVQRLTTLFAKGRTAEAEKLAQEIRRTDPRQPIPYAILGDIARSRGNLNEAAKMYAYAAQFDPHNAIYQRRYEQLLEATVVVTDRRASTRLQAHDQLVAAPAVGLALIVIAAGFIALSGETSVFHSLAPISSWTVGLLFMLFLSGLAVGASLSIGNFLDRFASVSTTSVGRVGPAVVLGAVALVNFWVAATLYLILGLTQRAFNYSTTRLVLGVSVALLVMTLAAGISTSIHPAQVLLWGGNVAYVGALLGWMVSDTFRA